MCVGVDISTTEDEEMVASILGTRGLHSRRFSKTEKRNGKTPDFRVFKDDALKFYCEVKTVSRDNRLDEQLASSAMGEVVGGARNDPVFNRLTDDIHTAHAQFLAVNPSGEVPNVLVFVNHDSNCDERDMASVLTGEFVAADGSKHSIYKSFSEGRISDEKFAIHLYCWVENDKIQSMMVNEAHPAFAGFLRDLIE